MMMFDRRSTDSLTAKAVRQHADAVASKAGRIDIALNTVGVLHVQVTLFADLTFEDYARIPS